MKTSLTSRLSYSINFRAILLGFRKGHSNFLLQVNYKWIHFESLIIWFLCKKKQSGIKQKSWMPHPDEESTKGEVMASRFACVL